VPAVHGTEVYNRSLADNGTFVTTSGTAGNWTIRIGFNSASGTVNFGFRSVLDRKSGRSDRFYHGEYEGAEGNRASPHSSRDTSEGHRKIEMSSEPAHTARA